MTLPGRPAASCGASNPDTLYSPGYGERAGGIDNFLQLNWLGSTRYITDSSGAAAQSYDAWGVRDAQGPGSPNHPTDLQWGGAWRYQTEWSNGASEPGRGLDGPQGDSDDRLRAVTRRATSYLTASYDGEGLRIGKTGLWTGTHNYTWGPGGVLTDDNGQGDVYTPGLARRQGSTDLFIERDAQGSTRTLENSSGTLFPNGLWYDAYGNRSFTGGTPYDPIDFQFGGGWGCSICSSGIMIR